MIETLTKYGFRFIGTCNCNGPKTEKYKLTEYTIYYNRRSKVFRVKKHGRVITPLKPESDIEEFLKEYFPAKTEVVLN